MGAGLCSYTMSVLLAVPERDPAGAASGTVDFPSTQGKQGPGNAQSLWEPWFRPDVVRTEPP